MMKPSGDAKRLFHDELRGIAALLVPMKHLKWLRADISNNAICRSGLSCNFMMSNGPFHSSIDMHQYLKYGVDIPADIAVGR